MESIQSYQQAAAAYADAARAFFEPAARDRVERSAAAGLLPAPELTARAEILAQRSAALTSAGQAQLAADDLDARLRVSVGLLAKALTDLQASRALLDAAEEDGGQAKHVVERGAGAGRPADLEANLRLLTGEAPAVAKAVERGAPLPKSVKAARAQLSASAPAILVLIRDRAASTGWDALSGLSGLGAAELASAAGLVGMQAAEALGKAAEITRIYELVRGLIGQAYESIQSALGPVVTQMLGAQVVSWMKDAATGKQFAALVEKLYETDKTCPELAKLASTSKAGLSKYLAAIQAVDQLEETYRKQVDLIGKILKYAKIAAVVPAAALPQGKLIMAAFYILLGGYAVLAGGDYADAKHLKLIDRVPGVRRVLETNLA